MRWLILIVALWIAPTGVTAQDNQGAVLSPILTVDRESLYLQSGYGQQIQRQLESASAELAAENRKIEAELIAEESQLTEDRPTMDPDDFRQKAEAFDAKVVEIRQTQDEKTRLLFANRDKAQQQFYQDVLPILTEIIRERGSYIVLESRSVFLSAGQIDITDAAIRRIDAEFLQNAESQPQAE